MAKDMIRLSKTWQWRMIYLCVMGVLGWTYLYSSNMERELEAFIIHEANLSEMRAHAIRDAAQARGGKAVERPQKFKVNPGVSGSQQLIN